MITADARPRPRGFWADARFILGVVLIIGSIAGVAAVVAAARQTAPAYSAVHTIVAGQAVTLDDLALVDVSLGLRADAYLAPGALEPDTVARRTIDEGELVPVAALGPAAAALTTTVVVVVDDHVPAVVDAGTAVDVWAAPPSKDGGFAKPRVLAADAAVRSVSRSDRVMGGSATAIEVVIARADVVAVLGALADGARLSVIPATVR